MLLKIFGRNSNRIIQLHPQFFTTQIEKRMGKTTKITPFKKALDLSKDLLGRDYHSHILEENGTVIENTAEDNSLGEPAQSFNRRLSLKVSKALS